MTAPAEYRLHSWDETGEYLIAMTDHEDAARAMAANFRRRFPDSAVQILVRETFTNGGQS